MRKKFKEFKNKPSVLVNRRVKIHTSILSSFEHSNLLIFLKNWKFSHKTPEQYPSAYSISREFQN